MGYNGLGAGTKMRGDQRHLRYEDDKEIKTRSCRHLWADRAHWGGVREKCAAGTLYSTHTYSPYLSLSLLLTHTHLKWEAKITCCMLMAAVMRPNPYRVVIVCPPLFLPTPSYRSALQLVLYFRRCNYFPHCLFLLLCNSALTLLWRRFIGADRRAGERGEERAAEEDMSSDLILIDSHINTGAALLILGRLLSPTCHPVTHSVTNTCIKVRF